LPKELLRGASSSGGGGSGMIDVLYVDEFSFNFFARKEELLRYQRKTFALGNRAKDRRHPPGNEIYRCGNLSSEWMRRIIFVIDHVNVSSESFFLRRTSHRVNFFLILSMKCLRWTDLKNGYTARIYATSPNYFLITKRFTSTLIRSFSMYYARSMNVVRYLN